MTTSMSIITMIMMASADVTMTTSMNIIITTMTMSADADMTTITNIITMMASVDAVTIITIIMQMKYLQAGVARLLRSIQTLSEAEDLGVILRAKGMVDGKDGQWIYFDMVPEEYEVRTGTPQITGKICVIGSKMAEDKIAEIFGVNE